MRFGADLSGNPERITGVKKNERQKERRERKRTSPKRKKRKPHKDPVGGKKSRELDEIKGQVSRWSWSRGPGEGNQTVGGGKTLEGEGGGGISRKEGNRQKPVKKNGVFQRP